MPVNGRDYNSHMPHGSNRRFGRAAEWLALLLLTAKGYRLRDRNWRAGRGELDLVARDGEYIVFTGQVHDEEFGLAVRVVALDVLHGDARPVTDTLARSRQGVEHGCLAGAGRSVNGDDQFLHSSSPYGSFFFQPDFKTIANACRNRSFSGRVPTLTRIYSGYP